MIGAAETLRPAAGAAEEERLEPPSVLLRALPQRVSGARVRLDTILDVLGSAAPGYLLLILALPALVPTGLPTAVPLGFALMGVGAMMAVSARPLTIPPWLGRRTITRGQLEGIVRRAVPVVARLERLMAPRLPGLLGGPARRLVGVLTVLHGLLIALPIPFGNAAPALAVAVMALGLSMRDGLAVLIGLAGSVLAFAISAGLVALGFEVFASLLG